MHTYSQDIRDRVIRALERGEGPSHISRRFEVSRVFVYEVKNRFEKEGERTSRRVGGHRVSVIAPLEVTIRSWITQKSDMTLKELSERLRNEFDIQLKPGAVWHQLNRWGLSFKKNASRQRARKTRRRDGTNRVAR